MNMKRTDKREKNLNKLSLDLNKSFTGFAPCLNEALKIDRQINERTLNEIKINEISKVGIVSISKLLLKTIYTADEPVNKPAKNPSTVLFGEISSFISSIGLDLKLWKVVTNPFW